MFALLVFVFVISSESAMLVDWFKDDDNCGGFRTTIWMRFNKCLPNPTMTGVYAYCSNTTIPNEIDCKLYVDEYCKTELMEMKFVENNCSTHVKMGGSIYPRIVNEEDAESDIQQAMMYCVINVGKCNGIVMYDQDECQGDVDSAIIGKRFDECEQGCTGQMYVHCHP